MPTLDWLPSDSGGFESPNKLDPKNADVLLEEFTMRLSVLAKLSNSLMLETSALGLRAFSAREAPVWDHRLPNRF